MLLQDTTEPGGYVGRVPADVTAAQRARWLAELSSALDRARDVLREVDEARRPDVDTHDLAAQVERARAQVRSLRLIPRAQLDFDPPEWSSLLLWDRRNDSCEV